MRARLRGAGARPEQHVFSCGLCLTRVQGTLDWTCAPKCDGVRRVTEKPTLPRGSVEWKPFIFSAPVQNCGPPLQSTLWDEEKNTFCRGCACDGAGSSWGSVEKSDCTPGCAAAPAPTPAPVRRPRPAPAGSCAPRPSWPESPRKCPQGSALGLQPEDLVSDFRPL